MVLFTKHVVPRYTATRVPRLRLSEAVVRHVRQAAALLVAPPGYGKTVLLAEVAEALNRPLVWLQVDEGDNDPVAFLAALAEGVRRTFPDLACHLEGLGDADAARNEERLLAMIVNAFDDSPTREWTLVIDDLHLLANRRALALVTKLVDYPPPGAAILIASRTRPALPVNRWLARGVARQFDVDDLRFTLEEATAWLLRDFPDLTPEVVAQLVERTEGWGAGLHLARGLLSGGADAAALAGRLRGSNPAVGGYLMDEVFARQPDEVQRFLLRSAVLPQFDAASCAALLGEEPAACARLIERLTREQTFLQPLDAEGRWYRYHALFREFLLQRLEGHDPRLATALRMEAGRAAEARADLAAAVGFYLDADALPDAARLLEAHGPALLGLGRGEALHRWLVRLRAQVDASPRLQLLLGRVLHGRGLLHQASRELQKIGEAAGADTRSAALTELAVIARSQGDYRRAAEWARQAAAVRCGDAGPSPGVRAAALMELAQNEGHLCGMEVGRRTAEQALAVLAPAPTGEAAAGEADRPATADATRRLRADLLGTLGRICWWQGDVDSAVAYLSEALEGLDDADGLRAADVHLALASPTLYRQDHRAALRHAERALTTYQRHEARERIPAAYAVLGNAYTRAGELDRAEALLRSGIALADEIDGASYDRVMAAGYLAHVLELQGRVEEAAQVAGEAVWAFEGGPIGYELYVCHSVLADTFLSAGRWREAQRIYAELVEIGEQRQYRIPLALAYFGLAYIELEWGDEVEGVRLAGTAFDMLAPSHAWQLVADQGPRAERVLEALRPTRPTDPFITRIAQGMAGRLEPAATGGGGARPAAARADVEVELLGELRVSVDGEPLPARAFTSTKARDLLAYLVAHRDETITIETALAALWPTEPDRAKTALHTALYRLRKALQRGNDDPTRFVLVESGRYRLDRARFDIDLDRFESLVSQAREARPERQVAALRQAVGLVRGEALAGLDYAWADSLRARLADPIANAFHKLGEVLLATGRPEEVLLTARRALSLDALDERAHLLLMRAQHALGDLVGLELTYRRLRDLLATELGLEPTAETERQYRALTLPAS